MSTEQVTEQVTELPLVVDRVEVRRAERISPSFVRIELGGDCLAGFGVAGGIFDQRFKVIFPNAEGELPDFAATESWWEQWMEIPEAERGAMRTYTVREAIGTGVDTRLVIDIVVHEGGATGPGNNWALNAEVGDQVIIIAPRLGHEFGGIEWVPGDAKDLLIVGDETAVPAVAGILRDLPRTARGAAYVEVPDAGDVQELAGPEGVQVTWLPRGSAARGALLDEAVLAHLGAAAEARADLVVEEDQIDPDLWETPAYSSSGEDVAAAVAHVGDEWDGLYAWIAGESKVVTGLRRVLVKDLGIDRHQVAFMGYWREGVAMRG